MLNVGAGEVLVILLVALIVLGPTKLPEAAKQVGKAMTQLRRMTSGFQREFQDAIKEPVDGFKEALDGTTEAEARQRGKEATERMAARQADDAGAAQTSGSEPAANGDSGPNGTPHAS